MKLCTFSLITNAAHSQLGLVEGQKVYAFGGTRSLAEYLASGDSSAKKSGKAYPLSKVTLHAPVPRPGKILAAIVNTRGMLGGEDVQLDRPRLDMKAPSTVVGPGVVIGVPATGIRPEVELAAIIGRRITRAGVRESRAAIAGFTVLNDVTSPLDSKEDAYQAYRRDRASGDIRKTVMRGPLFRSKNHDGFCPMGPVLVTPEEVDSGALKMSTTFEGNLVQQGSTAEYIFSPEEIASYVSSFLTLEPGDVVSCGSVGWTRGAIRDLDPTEYILPGRRGVLEVVIEGIGVLRNPIAPRD